jgi:hypothetical protein
MPGDALIPDPTDLSMQAVTVNAPPEDIWPWLVQIGYQRGGLYSYDWLDRLFGYLDRPSATRILPEFQRLAVGDEIHRLFLIVASGPEVSDSRGSCPAGRRSSAGSSRTGVRSAATSFSSRIPMMIKPPR